MTATAKNIYTISPDAPFLDEVVEGLWQRSGGDVFRLSQSLVLMPTRRACLHLREAFVLRPGMKAALLPRLQPLGDVDEDEFYFESLAIGGESIHADLPLAITPLRRQLLLTRLIRQKDPEMPFDQAVQLAKALAHFLDQVHIEECSIDRLAGLVDDHELAKHWQDIVRFLDILTKEWPNVLKDEECLDPPERRNQLLKIQMELWQKSPPTTPVIAAGSTGSMKATARLLGVIAGLPTGCVILPGLDQTLPEDAWQEITESHPQYGLKSLLETWKVDRKSIPLWRSHITGFQLTGSQFSGSESSKARVRLLQEAMRPATVTDEWRKLKPSDLPLKAVKGLERLDLDHPQHEAQVIALRMREALETPERTAVLVTPDRELAERVRMMLGRWGIVVNDSAGTSLTMHPVGAYLTALLEAAAPDGGAVDYLTLLKHPLTACGQDPVECREKVRQMELALWRRSRPEPTDQLSVYQKMLHPLASVWHEARLLEDFIRLHIQVAETFAATSTTSGMERLWRGDDGKAAAEWLNDWQNAAVDFPKITGDEYRALFISLLRTVTVRPSYGQHPRLSILGPLEARTLRADLMILGSLNEGVWPPEPVVDPWMSRAMKQSFGLPSSERRIGLAAHDFVQLAAGSEVMLTRAKRAGNSPTVPSRFLLQLDAVLQALGYSDDKKNCLQPAQPWAQWALLLDRPDAGSIKPCARPQPRPPLAHRPQRLSVTEISTWLRNPYAIYAKHILKLRKLEELDAAIDASDRGIVIHETLEQFAKQYPDKIPPDALEKLQEIGRPLFAVFDQHPEVKAFWWPRFLAIASAFIELERSRRAEGTVICGAEISGRVVVSGLTLDGRVDRVDQWASGGLEIIDYKTGSVPTKKSVMAGYEPQLALLAAIAQQGGFKDIPASPVEALSYWELKGGNDPLKPHVFSEETVAELVTKAMNGLEALVRCFADPATPYEAVPKPRWQPLYNDYSHLSRLAEWGRTENEE